MNVCKTELNAYLMSSFTMNFGSCKTILLLINLRTWWTDASARPLTGNPSWIGDNPNDTALKTA